MRSIMDIMIGNINILHFSGLTCWEIENFLPNQLDEGMLK